MAIQLALLSGAVPRTCARGPRVRLQRGKWRLGCAGLDDSILHLVSNLHPSLPINRDAEFELLENDVVYVDFASRGNEKFISIFVTKVA